MRNKKPVNNKGEAHGHWEVNWSNGNLWRKGSFINGVRYGYWEVYYANGILFSKRYYGF